MPMSRSRRRPTRRVRRILLLLSRIQSSDQPRWKALFADSWKLVTTKCSVEDLKPIRQSLSIGICQSLRDSLFGCRWYVNVILTRSRDRRPHQTWLMLNVVLSGTRCSGLLRQRRIGKFPTSYRRCHCHVLGRWVDPFAWCLLSLLGWGRTGGTIMFALR